MESFLSVGATERISLFRLLQCNLGAIVSLFIPHGAKLVGSRKKKKSYPIEIQREAKLSVGGGLPILSM